MHFVYCYEWAHSKATAVVDGWMDEKTVSHLVLLWKKLVLTCIVFLLVRSHG